MLTKKLGEVILELDKHNDYYRKMYMEALDVDDLTEAKEKQENAFEKIQKIKEFKSILSKLCSDIDFIKIDTESTLLSDVIEKSEIHYSEKDDYIQNQALKKEEPCANNAVLSSENNVTRQENKPIDSTIYIEDTGIENALHNVQDPIIEPISDDKIVVSIFGEIYRYASYGKIFKKISEELIYRKPYEMAKLPYNNDLKTYFTYNQSDLEFPEKLSNGSYIETNINYESILEIIVKMHSICELNENDITIKNMK